MSLEQPVQSIYVSLQCLMFLQDLDPGLVPPCRYKKAMYKLMQHIVYITETIDTMM